MSVDSTELVRVLTEAEDIASSVGQKLTTAHLLLAAFTVPNRAQVLLRERGVDENALLESLTRAPKEPESVVRELLERTRELAHGCGSDEVDCGHLLIATTRQRDCLAHDLLNRCGIDQAALRNQVLAYYTSGNMPRRLQNLDLPLTRTASPSPPRPVGRSLAGASAPTLTPTIEAPRVHPKPEPEPLAATRAEPPVESKFETHFEPLVTPPAPQARAQTQPNPAPAAPARPASKASEESWWLLDEKEFPSLTSLGRNLTELAVQGRIDPVIGREREIDEIIDILGKRRTNNPCLIGEPGVGKTAVVEGASKQLLELSRRGLERRVVVELDMASIVAGTQLRGSFSEKLNAIKEEMKRAGGRVICFIDEIHTLIGAGGTGEGPQDAANELKSALARGEFPCIGATTHDEYRQFIQQDPALERRFTPVVIKEPTVAQTQVILQGIIGRYEEHHAVRYAPEALEAAASLAAKYVSDRFLPDKAISIIDLAGSRSRRESRDVVEAADIARIVSRLAGIPEERLMLANSDHLLRLESELTARVIGHEEIIGRVARVVRRNYAGFSSRRPMGSFLFLGPTGVGKTELARAVAEVLFGGSESLVRVDMSECSEQHGVARLVGAPPGYVGYGDSGQLTEPVRRRPSSVVLLDEIEKAHRDVLMLLLQVLEEGRLTDGKGRHIDFSNTVVILTTNLGADAFEKGSAPVGFGASSDARGADERALISARNQVPAELWNRLDERLVFRPLDRPQVSRIAALLLRASAQRLAAEKSIAYRAGLDVIDHLLAHGGYDKTLGARPMRQAVQRLVEAPLADAILAGSFAPGDTVNVGVDGGAIVFQRAQP